METAFSEAVKYCIKCLFIFLTQKNRKNPSIEYRYKAFHNDNCWTAPLSCCSDAKYMYILSMHDGHILAVHVYDMFDHQMVHVEHVIISISNVYGNVEDCFINEKRNLQFYVSTKSCTDTEQEVVAYELDKHFYTLSISLLTLASFDTPLIDLGMEFKTIRWLNKIVRQIGKNDSRDVISRLKHLVHNTPNCLMNLSKFTYLPYSDKLLLTGFETNGQNIQPFYQLEGQTERFMLGDYYEFVERPDHAMVGFGRNDIIDVY